MPRSMKAAISTTMNSRTFSRKYIAKLAFKVEHQALQEADRTKLEEHISFRSRQKRTFPARSAFEKRTSAELLANSVSGNFFMRHHFCEYCL
jgi:ribosomal protein L32